MRISAPFEVITIDDAQEAFLKGMKREEKGRKILL
jgi:hypothetical protein